MRTEQKAAASERGDAETALPPKRPPAPSIGRRQGQCRASVSREGEGLLGGCFHLDAIRLSVTSKRATC
jgi:hypothetical protein